MTSARFIVFSYLYLVKEQFFVLQINSKKFTSWKNKQKEAASCWLCSSVNDKKNKNKKKTPKKQKATVFVYKNMCSNSFLLPGKSEQNFILVNSLWRQVLVSHGITGIHPC